MDAPPNSDCLEKLEAAGKALEDALAALNAENSDEALQVVSQALETIW
jgi:hypothetical protein